MSAFDRLKLMSYFEVQRANTWVGTPQYISPELLSTNTTCKGYAISPPSSKRLLNNRSSSDIWAVGCIIYQMIAGRFPFNGLTEYLMWQKIRNLEYSFPDGFDEDAKDLIQKIFVRLRLHISH